MKKTIVFIFATILLIVLLLGGTWGYQTYLAPTTATPVPPKNAVSGEPKIISAEGRVIPRKFGQLSFKILVPSLVESVFFEKGDIVRSGQIIARLSGKEIIEAAIASAQLEAIAAQQAVDALFDNNELARANAQKAVADGKDNKFKAESQVNYLKSKVPQSQLDAAEAALTLADELLDNSRERVNALSSRGEDDTRYAAAMLALYTNEKIYNLALANVNYLNGLGRTDSRDYIKAEANLALATAQLNKAVIDYEILSKGPDPDQLILAQARLKNANAQLNSAQSSLNDLNLIAPFEGTIVQLNVKPGELANSTLPVVVLADLTGWKIETTDLTEKDVAYLVPNMQAVVRLDAFPGLEFQGFIQEIDLFGIERRGAANYTITLNFDPKNIPVRWEMTAFVDFSIPEIK